MNDYFALFDEPHRPWLDPEALKKRFLLLSAETHPDRVQLLDQKRAAEQRSAELNQAYQRLRQPKDRLQHLLELETGAKPAQIQTIPAELARYFVEVGTVLKQADGFLAEKAKVSSPLLQVQAFQTGQEWTDKLRALLQNLAGRQQEMLSELQAIDARWVEQARTDPVERATMLRRLEQLYRLFSYFTRWEAQIQERIVQLAL